MHRAIGRVFRGQCRKFRENDCPVAAGEEVRRNSKEEDQKNGFVPPNSKHTLEEAVAWTAGIALGYQLTHGRRRSVIESFSLTTTTLPSKVSNPVSLPEVREKSPCPFSLTSKVFSQPIFTQPSTALNVCQRKISTTSTVISSIDLTPFIHDDIQDSELPDRLSARTTVVEDDDIVFSFESDSTTDARKPVNISTADNALRLCDNPAEYGKKFGADLLSVLGAFEFLQAEAKAKSSTSSSTTKLSKKTVANRRSKGRTRTDSNSSDVSKNPSLRAIEIMKKGAELGSARAMYNIGVAYERINESQVAKEYYKRAAELGHPLATYNCAVFALKDGHLAEGYALMKVASDFDVPEAQQFMKMKPSGSVTLPVPVDGKVK